MDKLIISIKYHLKMEFKAFLTYCTNKKSRQILSNLKYSGDGLITTHYLPFEDSNIARAFLGSFEFIPKELKRLRDMQWRFIILMWAFNQTKYLKGEVVELGVWYGVLSKSLLNYFKNIDSRTFYLFDSWGQQGFKMQGPYKKFNYLADIYDVVKLRFKDDNVRLIRGILPDTLKSSLPNSISLLMIDLNSGKLEGEVLQTCWNKIVAGGIIYLDDYGQDFPEVRETINIFCKDYNQNILVFPSGQAIIIKN